MSEILEQIKAMPDISFIDNMTLQDTEEFLLSKFKQHYKENTGEEIEMDKADAYRLRLLTETVLAFQMLTYIDTCGKMNFLKYANGDYLDNLGVFKYCQRKQAVPATVYVKFSLAAAREVVETIEAGVMVTADQNVFFETTEENSIPVGDTYVTIKCTCTTTGTVGNGFGIGEIQTLATPSGFISTVTNTTASSGGFDIESDDDFRERIYLAPSELSTAGTNDKWISLLKDYNSEIEDVLPSTVAGSGTDTLTVLMKNGRLPTNDELTDLSAYCNREDIRTLGLQVTVVAPVTSSYKMSVKYYIAKSKKSMEDTIKANVEKAILNYIRWQGVYDSTFAINGASITEGTEQGKIGRDINPDELIYRLICAGAKRAVITLPTRTVVNDDAIASFNSTDFLLEYGGVEND